MVIQTKFCQIKIHQFYFCIDRDTAGLQSYWLFVTQTSFFISMPSNMFFYFNALYILIVKITS